jgi:hypothetical protein
MNKIEKNNDCPYKSKTAVACFVSLSFWERVVAGNTKGGSITVLLTSCLTGLESAV